MNTIYLATLIFGLICIITITVYLYTLIKRITKKFDSLPKCKCDEITIKPRKTWLHRAIPISIASLIIMLIIIYNPLVLFVLYFLMASMFVDILHIIIKKFTKTENKPFKIWRIIHTYFIIPVIFSVSLMVYGHFNIMNIQPTHYDISTDKSIRAEGYRVGLMADLHFGSSIDLKELERICTEISNADLDVMILCGDIVDESTSYDEMTAVFKLLGNIKSTFGTYFVYGNHDCQTYVPKPAFTKDQLAEAITKNNITILEDHLININDDLVLAGRNDASFSNSSTRTNIKSLLSNVDRDDYILVLDHQPTEYKQNASAGTDLLLSGHTHAGQFWPLNYVLEIIPFNDGVYGLEKINNMNTIITSGISGWAFPYKTSSPAEYVIIDIIPKK